MIASDSLPNIHRGGQQTATLPRLSTSVNESMNRSVSLPTLSVSSGQSSRKEVVSRSQDGHLVVESEDSSGGDRREGDLVVRTSSRPLSPPSSLGTNDWSEQWQKQQLLSGGIERSKVGWENEIARHILSLYASTHVAKHNNSTSQLEAKQLLDFVGEKQARKKKHGRRSDNDDDDDNSEVLMYAVPQFHANYDAHASRKHDDGEHGHTRHHKRQIHKKSAGADNDDADESMSEMMQSHKPFSSGTVASVSTTGKESGLRTFQEGDAEEEEDGADIAAEEQEQTTGGEQTPLPPSESTQATESKKKVKKKKKKKSMAASGEAGGDGRNTGEFMQSFLQRLQAEQVALRDGASDPNAFVSASNVTDLIIRHPYRTVNTIRMRRLPQKKHEVPSEFTLTVQGSPKVTAIWFTSTAEVFVDWSSLPGGRKLTAHLSVLYEADEWESYVQLLSLLILKLARRVRYGPEEFTAGTFGLTEKYGNTRPGQQQQQQQQQRRGRSGEAQTSDAAWYEPVVQRAMSSPQRRAASARYAQYDGPPSPPQTSHSRREQKLRFPGDPDYQSAAEDNTPLLTLEALQGLWEKLLHATLALGLRCWERGQAVIADVRHRQKLQRLRSQQAQPKQRGASASSAMSGPRSKPEDDPAVRRWFDRGMQLLSQCDRWLRDYDDLVPGGKPRRRYFHGLIQDAMAGYFYAQQRPLAARAFVSAALECFEEIDDPVLEAQAQLHAAAVETQLSNFKEAHALLYRVLAMVEGGRFGSADADPKRLCLVAVCYHNLAVAQLKLDAPDLACKASQNARRLARLCLAYSNRYLSTFQHTHRVALYDLQVALQQTSVDRMTPMQVQMVYHLAEALFAPEVVLEGENKESDGK